MDRRRVAVWWQFYWENKAPLRQEQFEYRLSFVNLVEFYVLQQLVDAGVRPGNVFRAHSSLVHLTDYDHPFSKEEVLGAIRTDGKKIYIDWKDRIINLDGSGQLNLAIVRDFLKQLSFKEGTINKFWPRGKASSIVIDPKLQFGQPIIDGTRIEPTHLFQLHQAGEPINMIAFMYELPEKAVEDAIAYYSAA
ncbi:MAG: DUF433 domain-containing protein [Bacteroidota bacterium]